MHVGNLLFCLDPKVVAEQLCSIESVLTLVRVRWPPQRESHRGSELHRDYQGTSDYVL